MGGLVDSMGCFRGYLRPGVWSTEEGHGKGSCVSIESELCSMAHVNTRRYQQCCCLVDRDLAQHL